MEWVDTQHDRLTENLDKIYSYSDYEITNFQGQSQGARISVLQIFSNQSLPGYPAFYPDTDETTALHNISTNSNGVAKDRLEKIQRMMEQRSLAQNQSENVSRQLQLIKQNITEMKEGASEIKAQTSTTIQALYQLKEESRGKMELFTDFVMIVGLSQVGLLCLVLLVQRQCPGANRLTNLVWLSNLTVCLMTPFYILMFQVKLTQINYDLCH